MTKLSGGVEPITMLH